jgi:type VI secretion system protein ImpH
MSARSVAAAAQAAPAKRAAPPAAPVAQPALAPLFTDGHHFDFLQVVHLLEQMFGVEVGRPENGHAERIRFRPYEGQAFPPADVKEVIPLRAEKPAAQVVLTFMGLYGASSPLPAHYAVPVSNEPDDRRPHQDFLDIFHQRLYGLFYRALKKYRFDIVLPTDARAEAIDRLRCAAGLGSFLDRVGSIPTAQLLPCAAILRSGVRSAEGLRVLLDNLLPGFSARIAENSARWVPIPERGGLGRDHRHRLVLGKTAVLGGRLLDVSGGFRVTLGPLTWQQYEHVLPGQPGARMVQDIVGLYVSDSLEYDVELRIWSRELPVTRLGSSRNRLGVTTWVGRPHREVVSEIVKYDQEVPE